MFNKNKKKNQNLNKLPGGFCVGLRHRLVTPDPLLFLYFWSDQRAAWLAMRGDLQCLRICKRETPFFVLVSGWCTQRQWDKLPSSRTEHRSLHFHLTLIPCISVSDLVSVLVSVKKQTKTMWSPMTCQQTVGSLEAHWWTHETLIYTSPVKGISLMDLDAMTYSEHTRSAAHLFVHPQAATGNYNPWDRHTGVIWSAFISDFEILWIEIQNSLFIISQLIARPSER